MRLPGALLILGLVACSTNTLHEAVDIPLVVASDLDNLPFAGLDGIGLAVGRDVEMMEAVALELGHRVDWRRMPFDQLLPTVEVGEVSVVCATLGITPERSERVLFSRPYFRTSIVALVRKGDGEPRNLKDLVGRPVAAGKGTTSERAVRRHLPSARGVFENKTGLSSAERLASGAVDAVVMDGPAAAALAGASKGSLMVLDQPLDEELYALALPPDATELKSRIDAVLEYLEETGQLADLDSEYGLD